MTTVPPAPPYRPVPGSDPRRWLYAGLAALFVLIGVSIALNIAFAIWRDQLPAWSINAPPWNWIIGLIGVLIAVWIVVWVLRLVFWGVWGAAYGRPWRHYRHHWHYHGGPFGSDSAVEIARERYARGEITQEQLDQILHQLGKDYGPPPV